ncbi:MAG: hypothetical protein J3Q66DRAFT_351128 [Benniella sp.]|nr:MAG: hypothetical protein J3Q66DRAFT_351128 [Benniella sp.]
MSILFLCQAVCALYAPSPIHGDCTALNCCYPCYQTGRFGPLPTRLNGSQLLVWVMGLATNRVVSCFACFDVMACKHVLSSMILIGSSVRNSRNESARFLRPVDPLRKAEKHRIMSRRAGGDSFKHNDRGGSLRPIVFNGSSLEQQTPGRFKGILGSSLSQKITRRKAGSLGWLSYAFALAGMCQTVRWL